MRSVTQHFWVANHTLRRVIHGISQPRRERRGRKRISTEVEDRLIVDATLYFARNSTPLLQSCLKELIHCFVTSLSPERQSELPFRDARPGEKSIRHFISRHTGLCQRRQSNLEAPRATAM